MIHQNPLNRFCIDCSSWNLENNKGCCKKKKGYIPDNLIKFLKWCPLEKLNKYRNEKTVIDGYTFQSKKEANRYFELKMMQKAGEISDLELQPKFEIVPQVYWINAININASKTLGKRYYIADFSYFENGNKTVEDVKSAITRKNPVYTLKRQLFLLKYPGIVFKET